MENQDTIQGRLEKMSKAELESDVERWREKVAGAALRIARKLNEERDGQPDNEFDLFLATKHLHEDAEYLLALKTTLVTKR